MDLPVVPIICLKKEALDLLSAHLNPKKVIPNEKGQLRDWHGLAELCGMDINEIAKIEQDDDPTSVVLKIWSERTESDTAALMSYLEILDRFDVVDDVTALISNQLIKKDAGHKSTFKSVIGSAQKYWKQSTASGKLGGFFSKLGSFRFNVPGILSIERFTDQALQLDKQIYAASIVLFDEEDASFANEIVKYLKSPPYNLEICVNSDVLWKEPNYNAMIEFIRSRCNKVIVILPKSFITTSFHRYLYKVILEIEQGKRKFIFVRRQHHPHDLPLQLKVYPILNYTILNRNFWVQLYKAVTNEEVKKSAPPYRDMEINRKTLLGKRPSAKTQPVDHIGSILPEIPTISAYFEAKLVTVIFLDDSKYGECLLAKTHNDYYVYIYRKKIINFVIYTKGYEIGDTNILDNFIYCIKQMNYRKIKLDKIIFFTNRPVNVSKFREWLKTYSIECNLCSVGNISYFPTAQSFQNKQCYELGSNERLPYPFNLLYIVSIDEHELNEKLWLKIKEENILSRDLSISFARKIYFDRINKLDGRTFINVKYIGKSARLEPRFSEFFATQFSRKEIIKASSFIEMVEGLTYSKNPDVDFQIDMIKLFTLNNIEIQLFRGRVHCCNIVFKTKEKTILLQTKYAPEEFKMSAKQCFPNVYKFGNFSIYKYLKYFNEIENLLKQSIPSNQYNPVRVNKKNIDYVIFCTNIDIDLEDLNLFGKTEFSLNDNDCLMQTDDSEINSLYDLNSTKMFMFNPNCLYILSESISRKIEIPKENVLDFLKILRLVSINEAELDEKLSHINFEKSVLFDLFFNKMIACIESKNILNFANIINKSQSFLNVIPNKNKINFINRNKLKQRMIIKINNKLTYPLHLLKIQQQLLETGLNKNNIIFINIEDSIDIFFRSSDDLMGILAVVILIFDRNFDVFQLTKFLNNKQSDRKILILTDISNLKHKLKLEETNQTISFDDLILFTQKYILRKKIIFNNMNVRIENLIGPNLNTLNEIILFKLIGNDKIIVPSHKRKMEDETELYIKRFLRRRKKILSEMEFLENVTTKTSKKILLVIGDTGTGKTTVLNKIERLLSETNFWTIKLDMQDFVKLFHEQKVYPEFEKFLDTLEDDLDQHIFNLPNKIVLLIDNFEKILTFYPQLASDCLRDMVSRENIIKIVVTCRPYLSKTISNIIKIDSYHLQPISIQDIFFICESLRYKDENNVKKFVKNMNLTLTFEATCEYFTDLRINGESVENLSLDDIFIKEHGRLNYIDDTVLILAITNEILRKIVNEHIRQCKTSKVDIFFKLGALFLTEKQLNVYRTFAESFVAKHLCHLLKYCNLEISFIKYIIDDIFLNSTNNMQKFVNRYLESTPVSEKVKSIIGQSISDVKNVGIVELTENKLFNILELLLNRCAHCKHNYNNFDHHFPNNMWHLAIENNLIKTMSFLMERNFIDDHGNNFLHLAVLKNRPEITKLLLDGGYDVNIKNFSNQTPIDIAIVKSNFNIAKLLHQKSPKDKKYLTALLNLAVKNKSKNMVVSILLENVHNSIDISPLRTALRINSPDMADLLMEHFDQKSNREGNFVHLAVQNNLIAQLKKLLELKYPIHTLNVNGDTPLHVAVNKNSKEMVKCLVAHLRIETTSDIIDKEQNTPLHLAVINNSIELVKLLIDKIPNLADSNGDTALHLAVRTRSVELVSLFIEHNYDVTIPNNEGKTPLHLSAENGGKDMAKMLLEVKLKRKIVYDFKRPSHNFFINEI